MKSLVATLMLVCVVASASAQSMGEVVGSIIDQTGVPVAGVRMTIRGVAVRTVDTGAAGHFAFSDLPEGQYEVSAELSGFRPEYILIVKAIVVLAVLLVQSPVVMGLRAIWRTKA